VDPRRTMDSSTGTRWVPSRGVPTRILLFGVLLLILAFGLVGVVAASVGSEGVVHALGFAPSGSIGTGAIAVVWLFGVAAPVLLALLILSTPEVRVGIGPEGVELVSRIRRRRLRWDQLWPTYARPTGNWILVGYRTGERARLRYFWATKPQALALASYPKAPFNLFPPETRDWLGVVPPSSGGPGGGRDLA
jgi:hypothetical protein